MEKKEMVTRTLEGFIRKLDSDGHSKYASELKTILAMSRRRREATAALSSMASSLLTHIIKYVGMPQSRARDKWRREIKTRLYEFNIHNVSFQGKPWLSINYIEKELNEFLVNPRFLKYLTIQLEEYSNKDKKSVMNLINSKKTLKALNVSLSFDVEGNLNMNIENQPL